MVDLHVPHVGLAPHVLDDLLNLLVVRALRVAEDALERQDEERRPGGRQDAGVASVEEESDLLLHGVEDMRGEADVRDVEVYHLFSNRSGERTVVGWLS